MADSPPRVGRTRPTPRDRPLLGRRTFPNRIQQAHLSGFASFEAGIGVPATAPAARAGARMSNAGVNLCPRNLGSNVLVNQNCLNVADTDLQGRGQAQNETAIAQNPFNPRQLVAGFNDYRRGDGTCGTAFTSNGGASWTTACSSRGSSADLVPANLAVTSCFSLP